ncbi:ABC transporter substrate-binding protein [Corynebacterium sp. HMSC034A01]|uniref:ABC transporter substrate-binding protein n=1 Tax=Corynebacterium sp. HMSC034A01 TaxID=1739295 RepID=UPI0008A98909|nr:ABC transporter substrate-binding protein [Corynebacterium sp. HMSC034A01]OHR21210.1 ABC transporter substrate-binding protein [Corynebacterium sp. HMSC034A01]
MKKFIAALAGASAAFGLVACGSVESNDTAESTGANETNETAAADEWKAPEGLSGSIDYYSANPQGLTDALVEAFQEKTGVTVNVFAGTTGEVTAKIKAEEANPQADVVYLASWSAASKQAETGALESYKPENIDNANADWNAADDTFHGRDGSALALVANTDVVSDIPTDWEDLADPKYADQVIMPDPRESGTAADLLTAMIAEWGEDKTWELFDKLFDNGMIVQGANGPALDQVTSGSKGIVFGGVDYSAYSAQGKGEPLEVVIPSSGTTVTPRPVMIMKSTDNMDAAKAFVDFMFSEEAQQISASKNMIPSNKNVEPKNGPKLEDITQISDDWAAISKDSKNVREQFADRYLK